jgi:hypothetical protein
MALASSPSVVASSRPVVLMSRRLMAIQRAPFSGGSDSNTVGGLRDLRGWSLRLPACCRPARATVRPGRWRRSRAIQFDLVAALDRHAGLRDFTVDLDQAFGDALFQRAARAEAGLGSTLCSALFQLELFEVASRFSEELVTGVSLISFAPADGFEVTWFGIGWSQPRSSSRRRCSRVVQLHRGAARRESGAHHRGRRRLLIGGRRRAASAESGCHCRPGRRRRWRQRHRASRDPDRRYRGGSSGGGPGQVAVPARPGPVLDSGGSSSSRLPVQEALVVPNSAGSPGTSRWLTTRIHSRSSSAWMMLLLTATRTCSISPR